MPVTKIDERQIGSGKPGEVTNLITRHYWNMHDDDSNRLVVDYGGNP